MARLLSLLTEHKVPALLTALVILLNGAATLYATYFLDKIIIEKSLIPIDDHNYKYFVANISSNYNISKLSAIVVIDPSERKKGKIVPHSVQFIRPETMTGSITIANQDEYEIELVMTEINPYGGCEVRFSTEGDVNPRADILRNTQSGEKPHRLIMPGIEAKLIRNAHSILLVSIALILATIGLYALYLARKTKSNAPGVTPND